MWFKYEGKWHLVELMRATAGGVYFEVRADCSPEPHLVREVCGVTPGPSWDLCKSCVPHLATVPDAPR